VWAVLLASEKMNDQVAYDTVKTLFEKRPELVMVARDAEYMTFENQFGGATPIPFHPGALKYYAEKGHRPRTP